MLIIEAGQVIDGLSPQPLPETSILIENGRILSVVPTAEFDIPDGGEVVDARAQTVMPGMVDCHVHVHSPGGSDREYNYALSPLTELQGALALQAFANVQKDLAMGFTTLRSLELAVLRGCSPAQRDQRRGGGRPAPDRVRAGYQRDGRAYG